ILNHATFKGSLFMVAGIIDVKTGTRDIRKLGGLFTLMPITATLALFGTFSMAGVPLPFLNGFYSKEAFFISTLALNECHLLFTLMPITVTLSLFGTFSMSGFPLPFLNGFYSKEAFFTSTLALNEGTLSITNLLVTIIPYLAVLGSIFTFVYSMYLFFDVFMKKDKAKIDLSKNYEPSFGMLISLLILVIGVVL